ncbi:MAG: nuclear transport factor 2 family protein [Deltaproteobacteria bacterium]|nr:nuclear transport factor 2 family protein [Deltaproteobacteria bacterium]
MAKKAMKGVKPVREGRSNPKRIVIKKARTTAKRVVRRKPTPAVSSFVTASSLVEDHLAIQQLLHKYCHVVDRGTADEVAALFHRTAVLLPRYESDERYEGREAVRGWYRRYMEKFRAKVRYLRHKIESSVIEITGDEATAVCYLDADSITTSVNEANVAVGRYDDKFIKDEGRWWFKERTIIVYYSYPLALYRKGRGA